jgi:hypothetical protein
LPSRYLYLKTKLSETILGGVVADNFVKLSYMNSDMIIDLKGQPIKHETYGIVWLNPKEYFAPKDIYEVEAYSSYILWCVGGAVVFWLTISLSTDKTVMPVLLLLLGLQQFFYISC